MNLFITAIGTGCGKTITSAIFCEALKADYWKPIQSGTEDIDRLTVKNLLSNSSTQIHPERYLLHFPASPNIAAARESIQISLSDFKLPVTTNSIIVEGAGGILVPINNKGDMVIDIASTFQLDIILVVNLYLGCINHTLLTVRELQNRNLTIRGIVFNGEPNPEVETTILEYTGIKCVLRIEKEAIFDSSKIQQYAQKLAI